MDTQLRLSEYLAPRYWPTWLLLGILRALAFLPFSAQMRIGRALGTLLYHLVPVRRHVAAVNIRLCFPELNSSEQKKLLREHYQSLGMSVMETASLWFTPVEKLLNRVTFIGLEHVKKAPETGQGVLVVQAHFTTMEFLGNLL
ncbi:MAG TPA: lipid A biosynthesis lauroyl acyltransferase, partial [Gammaproteobacteria bacterium]|nr:lipid A biosynthesis lauroyl acyltransferase [Gammaproteobacteria bacterium]